MTRADRSQLLLADIGGTHARFALCGAGGAFAPHSIAVLPVADFSTPLAACRRYLAQVGHPTVSAAAFALACPIEGDRAHLTNARWRFDRRALQAALGLERLVLLNDFEALAWSLPGLTVDDGYRIGGRLLAHRATLGLIGPGTGLGVSGLVAAGPGGWAALQCEGGHASLAPADEREAEILSLLWQQVGHVSNERVLSGPGLPLLLRAIAQVDRLRGNRAPDDYADAAAVTAAAQAGDPLACATVDTFTALLGGAAGNLALTLGARGGVYIGGGVVPRLGPLFSARRFRQRFEAKGRFRNYLEAIPVFVITAPAPALAGAARVLRGG